MSDEGIFAIERPHPSLLKLYFIRWLRWKRRSTESVAERPHVLDLGAAVAGASIPGVVAVGVAAVCVVADVKGVSLTQRPQVVDVGVVPAVVVVVLVAVVVVVVLVFVVVFVVVVL